jgi:hypothetical protein
MVEEQETKATDDRDRPQYFEDLRFAKKQQWAVTTAAVTLLAAIYALQRSVDPGLGSKERVAVVVAIVLIATFGCIFLFMLQKHIRDTRLRLDRTDKDALLRGVSIVGVLSGVVILSAGCVLYFVALR